MNEYCEVVAQWMVETKSWFEVQDALKLLMDRYALLQVEVSSLTETIALVAGDA